MTNRVPSGFLNVNSLFPSRDKRSFSLATRWQHAAHSQSFAGSLVSGFECARGAGSASTATLPSVPGMAWVGPLIAFTLPESRLKFTSQPHRGAARSGPAGAEEHLTGSARRRLETELLGRAFSFGDASESAGRFTVSEPRPAGGANLHGSQALPILERVGTVRKMNDVPDGLPPPFPTAQTNGCT